MSLILRHLHYHKSVFCMRSHCISLILSYKSKTVFSDFLPSPCIENRINFEKLPQLLQSFHHTGMKICASDFLQNQSCWFTTSMVNVFSVHSLCVSLTFMSTLENMLIAVKWRFIWCFNVHHFHLNAIVFAIVESGRRIWIPCRTCSTHIQWLRDAVSGFWFLLVL